MVLTCINSLCLDVSKEDFGGRSLTIIKPLFRMTITFRSCSGSHLGGNLVVHTSDSSMDAKSLDHVTRSPTSFFQTNGGKDSTCNNKAKCKIFQE